MSPDAPKTTRLASLQPPSSFCVAPRLSNTKRRGHFLLTTSKEAHNATNSQNDDSADLPTWFVIKRVHLVTRVPTSPPGQTAISVPTPHPKDPNQDLIRMKQNYIEQFRIISCVKITRRARQYRAAITS